MAVWILDGDPDGAVFYCSTTMWAFGPVFVDRNQAEAFLSWLQPVDPREIMDGMLRTMLEEFLALGPLPLEPKED